MRVTVLCGGVGGARFLLGVRDVVGAARLTAVVNVGDDLEPYGLRVCPDLDSVVYALAGVADRARGWGRADETFHAFQALATFEPDAWFQLGDRDLATHLYRTRRAGEGAGLAAITAEIAGALGVASVVLPVTEDPVRTWIETDGGWLTFQQYHVRERSRPAVRAVRYEGAAAARPAPGVAEAIARADVVLIAPSNPVSSIGPMLAVPGVRAALAATAAPVVALSGLRRGRPFGGDAAELLAGVGVAPDVRAVARLYAPFLRGVVVDEADAAALSDLAAAGLTAIAVPAALAGREQARAVASACLAVAERVRA